jgi:hypothetical protein
MTLALNFQCTIIQIQQATVDLWIIETYNLRTIRPPPPYFMPYLLTRNTIWYRALEECPGETQCVIEAEISQTR